MKHFIQTIAATCIAATLAISSTPSRAFLSPSEASAMSVVVPIAAVASVGAGASAAVGASAVGVVAIPAALSVAGATLVVKSVEASAKGVVCVLERASDGARVSLEVTGRTVSSFGAAVGASVVVTVLASGTLIVRGGEAILFIPNELGRALTHNEKL